MDYENAYDDGGKRRTTIIVIVVAVVLLIGVGIIVALVLRNRSMAGTETPSNVNGGAQQEVNVPPAAFQFQQEQDSQAVVGGTAIETDQPPSQEAAPQPGVDRMLTDEEKRNYGYPIEWTVRMRTVRGNLGLQTEVTVVDKGSWSLPTPKPGDAEKRESAPVAPEAEPATP